jgi:hypothetical protein
MVVAAPTANCRFSLSSASSRFLQANGLLGIQGDQDLQNVSDVDRFRPSRSRAWKPIGSPSTEAALLAPKLLFDIAVHGLSEGMLKANHGIALCQNILLEEPETAYAGLGRGGFQVFVNGSFGQRNGVWVSPGNQPA